MDKPSIVVLAGEELFTSFFSQQRQKRLSKLAKWSLCTSPVMNRLTLQVLSDADAIITTWDSPFLSAKNLTQMPRLRMIAHCGGEVKKHFDRTLFDKLTITNTPSPMTRPTAELGASLLLYSARNVDHYRSLLGSKSNRAYHDVHLGRGGESETLLGREVGMIGFGRIGRAMVDLLSGFDIRWRVYDPYASRSVSEVSSVQFTSLNNVLKHSSLLAITAAATEKTKGLLDQKRLAMLPDGAVVVNVARGSIINLADITKEVLSGRLRCALDVTDPEEPLPLRHPLRSAPGAILTPHIGGGGRQVRGQMADLAMADLDRFFRGEKVQSPVSPTMLSRMT